MPRQTEKHMLALARLYGATRKDGRPDWYLLAEHLAALVDPDAIKPAGAKNSSLRLFRDVKLMMLMEQCGVRKACRLLAEGHDPHRGLTLPLLSDGTPVAIPRIGKGWKGRDPDGLRVRYEEWVRNFANSFPLVRFCAPRVPPRRACN